MRKRGRVDNIQAATVKAMRSAGMTVAILSSVGGGVPDLVVGFRKQTFLVEVKTGDADLTKDEREFMDKWAGQLFIARSPEDAVVQVLKASK